MLIAADWCRSLLIAAEYADGCSKLNEGRTLVCQMKLWNTSTIVWVDIICVSILPNLDLKSNLKKGYYPCITETNGRGDCMSDKNTTVPVCHFCNALAEQFKDIYKMCAKTQCIWNCLFGFDTLRTYRVIQQDCEVNCNFFLTYIKITKMTQLNHFEKGFIGRFWYFDISKGTHFLVVSKW